MTPLVHFLRGLGLQVRPPNFAPFWANVMLHGFVFTFVWGILIWMLACGDAVPPAGAAVAALVSDIAVGLVVALLCRATAERADLPQ